MRQFWRRGSALGLLLLAGGCRDLDVPPPGPGVAPEVRFVSPDVTASAGARVPQTLAVTLEAQDANGIRSLALSCGATPLFNWTAPPFIATVDLRPCTVSAGADAGTVGVTLTARAVDGTGVEGSASIEVQVDASAPGLTVLLPERVAPGQPFDVQIQSDRALAGVPLVSVEGVTVEARSAGPNAFVATMGRAPLLGAETWDGGGTPPLALLEELERPLDVIVEARGQNGNAAPRVVARTFVSRIAWERSIPGVALGAGASDSLLVPQLPVATPQGLVLPVAIDPSNPSGNAWLPVQLRAANGEVRTVPASALTTSGRTPYSGAGIDLAGRVLLSIPGSSARYYDFEADVTQLPQPLPAGATATAVAVGEELCFAQEVFTTCTSLQLTCVQPNGARRAVPLSANYIMRLPAAMVASGSRVLLLGLSNATCCPGLNSCTDAPDMYVDAAGAKGFVTLFPASAGPTPPPGVQRALPLEGGAIALDVTAVDGTQTVYRLGTDLSLSQPWPQLRAVAGRDTGTLVSGRIVGEQLLTLNTSATQSTVARHAPGASGVSQLIPAAFIADPVGEPELDRYAVRTPRGVAALVRLPDVSTDVGALVSLDDSGQPRWIYRYERTDDGRPAVIAGSQNAGLVYLVDLRRQRVVALYP